MIFTVLLLAAISLAGIVLMIAGHPGEFIITRQAEIAAPAGTVSEHVNDLKLWQSWSPWARMDPDAKTEFDGPAAGVGAAMRWTGRKSGAGRMTIIDVQPLQSIRLRLEFFKPMKAVNTAEFTFVPHGAGTLVTWTMFGSTSFVGKIMSLVMNCDKMVGKQFDQGFANLNEVVRARHGAAQAA